MIRKWLKISIYNLLKVMANKLEISFNSPQCGWMSIGFDNGENEFHTTTAHTPYETALSDILKSLTALIGEDGDQIIFKVPWSRNPEAYNLFFVRHGGTAFLQVVEYPTFDHLNEEGKIVFTHCGSVEEFCQTFAETFNQLYADRETDEFEFNWRQPFPIREFEEFKKKFPTDVSELTI